MRPEQKSLEKCGLLDHSRTMSEAPVRKMGDPTRPLPLPTYNGRSSRTTSSATGDFLGFRLCSVKGRVCRWVACVPPIGLSLYGETEWTREGPTGHQGSVVVASIGSAIPGEGRRPHSPLPLRLAVCLLGLWSALRAQHSGRPAIRPEDPGRPPGPTQRVSAKLWLSG